MTISREDLHCLCSLGYNDIEARFLYLVATHSGHFTTRQFLAFAGLQKGCMLDRFTTRLLDQKHARAIEYARNTRVFNVFSRKIYGALGKDNLRNRRQLSDELIHTRLLILDLVLAQPEHRYLETEAEKVSFFHEKLGIPLSVLPGHVYAGIKSLSTTKRYFVDRFPIFLTIAGTGRDRSQEFATFTYCDCYGRDLKPFLHHLQAYQPFLLRLPHFEFVYASPDPAKFERARRVFDRLFSADANESRQSLVRYFSLRKLWEERKYNSLTREDRDLLRAGNVRYAAERFQSAYKTWLKENGSLADTDAVRGTDSGAQPPVFHTQLLPNRYDFFVWQAGPNYRTIRRNHSSIDSSSQSTKFRPDMHL